MWASRTCSFLRKAKEIHCPFHEEMKPFPTETAVSFASFPWTGLLRGSDQKVNLGMSHTAKADLIFSK